MTIPTKLENQKPVGIDVNVMRSRLTAIGFNIAIVSFQIAQLYRVSGGLNVAGLNHPIHVMADISLYMALALSLIALITFIMSCELDEIGVCTHWTFIAGDLLMYLALAYTVAGFFQPIGESIRNISTQLPGQATETLVLQQSVLIAGGIAWFLAMYFGPLVSLMRSPFARATNLILAIAYLLLVLLLSWVNSQADIIEVTGSGYNLGVAGLVLQERFQPFQW